MVDSKKTYVVNTFQELFEAKAFSQKLFIIKPNQKSIVVDQNVFLTMFLL